MSRPPTLNSLKTVGRKTPRIDAVERVDGKSNLQRRHSPPRNALRARAAQLAGARANSQD